MRIFNKNKNVYHASCERLDFLFSRFKKIYISFSGGKDSIVVTHLARKAFYPSKIPFALMHVDTGHNFPETIKFRDDLIEHFKHLGNIKEI